RAGARRAVVEQRAVRAGRGALVSRERRENRIAGGPRVGRVVGLRGDVRGGTGGQGALDRFGDPGGGAEGRAGDRRLGVLGGARRGGGGGAGRGGGGGGGGGAEGGGGDRGPQADGRLRVVGGRGPGRPPGDFLGTARGGQAQDHPESPEQNASHRFALLAWS